MKNSCYLFDEDSQIRKTILWLITSKSFRNISLFFFEKIFLNSIMKFITILICILNLFTFVAYDYEYRLDKSIKITSHIQLLYGFIPNTIYLINSYNNKLKIIFSDISTKDITKP